MTEQPHPDQVRLLPWAIPAWVIDSVLVAVVVAGFFGRPFADGETLEAADWIALPIGVALILTRRRFALVSLAVATAASIVVVAVTDRPSMLMPVTLVVLFTVALEHDRRTTLLAGTATTLLIGVAVIAFVDQGRLEGAGLAAIAWPGFAATAGSAIRSTRENLAAAQERARRAEESRELEAQRRVVEERLRIARDVHDMVAHHIAVINVQAGVAQHFMESNRAEAAKAVDIVRDAATTVVDQLGELLGVLRSPDDVDDPTTPTPNLAAIEDLISSFANSGLVVAHETSGSPRPLSASAELAAYRVVQEALTNAHKYGDGTATVAMRFNDAGLELTVANPASEVAAEGTGFGLIGMRERVEAVGGQIEAGRSNDGRRFEISASIPGRDFE